MPDGALTLDQWRAQKAKPAGGGMSLDEWRAKKAKPAETEEQRGQREYNAQADADVASGRSTINSDAGGYARTGAMNAADTDTLAEGSSRVNAAARAEHPYMTRVAEAALAPAAVPIETTADLVHSQEPGGRNFDKPIPWDEIGGGALKSGAAVAFAPAEVALAPVAPLLDPAFKKADEYIGQPAAFAAAGMPDAPEWMPPGAQGRLPTSETAREAANLGAMLAGGKVVEMGANEVQLARGVRPDAKALDAIRPGRTTPTEPSLANAPNAPQARFTNQPPDVNHRPYVEPPRSLVDSTTPAARQLPGGRAGAQKIDDALIPPYEPVTPVDEALAGAAPAAMSLADWRSSRAKPSAPAGLDTALGEEALRGELPKPAALTGEQPQPPASNGVPLSEWRARRGQARGMKRRGGGQSGEAQIPDPNEFLRRAGEWWRDKGYKDITEVPDVLLASHEIDQKRTALAMDAAWKEIAPDVGSGMAWQDKAERLADNLLSDIDTKHFGENYELTSAPRDVLVDYVQRMNRIYRGAGYDEVGFSRGELASMSDAELGSFARRYLDDAGAGDNPNFERLVDSFGKERPERFRGGMGMGRGGSESGSVPIVDYAKAAEGWIEGTEKIAKPIVEAVGGKLKRAFPKTADLAEGAYTHVLRSPERKISQGFEDVVNEGRATERGLSAKGKEAVVAFEKATKGLDEAQRQQVGRSLSSEDADLSALDQPTRQAVESMRSTIQALRSREVSAGTMSPEVQSEYPQGHLKRVLKPGNVVERMIGRRGGVSVKSYEMAGDMHSVELKMPSAEAHAIVQELGLSPRLLKQYGDRTTIKFNADEYGAAERQAFVDEVKSRFSEARSKLGADATREIKAGDVGQAKQFMRAQADVPSAAALDVKTSDPIPPEIASRIFEPGVAKRAHVTLQESARRIGKAETLRDISKLTDEKGPVAIEPKSLHEPTPEGYELVDNKNFGELHRKFVRKDVLEYVRGAYDGTAKGMTRGVADGLMERFKVAQLAYAPRQAFRQFVSNMEFENLAGMSNWNLPRYLVSKVKGIRAMRKASPYREALVKNGFLDPAHVSEAELGLAEEALGETRYDVGKRIGRALGTLGATEIAPNKLRRMERAAWKWYSTSDAWTKATIYVHAIEELKLSPKDAAAYVRKWTPSPESVSNMVKTYSGSILGDPWARFKAETLRINAQAVREGKLVRLAMNAKQKALIRTAAVLGGASLLSDDEEKSLKNEQGEGALALGRNEKGEPLAVDYSFLSTMNDLFDTPSRVGKPGEHLRERILQLTGLGDNPIYGAAAQAITGENQRTGKPLNPEGTVSGEIAGPGKLFLQQWVPALATRQLDKLRAAWKGDAYSPNQPKQTKSQAVLDVFFGFKLSPLDAEQALSKISRQGRRALGDLRASFRDKALRGEEIDQVRVQELADLLMQDYRARAEPLERLRAKEGLK